MSKAKDGKDSTTMTETLRQAIRDTGLSLRKIARAAGIDERAVARFTLHGLDLRGKSIDRLVEALGLELTSKKDRQKG